MGIPGLTAFIEAEYNEWENKTLRTATDGKLIVDGNCLCWHLLRDIDCSHGGQYWKYKQAVRRFFEVLKQEGVSPIVVMDGVNLDQNWETRAKKRSEKITRLKKKTIAILTCFLLEVFCSTVTELELKLCVADGGADETVAKLANHYSCPVLAEDSDYFIYNLRAGYIPLALNKLDLESPEVKLKIYKREKFAHKFNKFQQTSLCYAIPAIFGNDFLPSLNDYVKKICPNVGESATERYKAVCQYLSEFSSLEAYKDTLKKTKTMEECEKLYSIEFEEQFDFEQLLHSGNTGLKHCSGDELPQWLLMAFRRGNFPPYFIEAAVYQNTILPIMYDDVKSATSTGLSDHIRQCLYALLSCDKVTEYVRVERDITKTALCVEGIRIPNLFEIQDLSEAQKKEVLYYAILGCNAESLSSFDGKYSKWKFTAAVTMYWAKKVCMHMGTIISHELIKALIACFLRCNSDYHDDKFECTTECPYWHSTTTDADIWEEGSTAEEGELALQTTTKNPKKKMMNAFHAFSQWQYAYHCTLAVNTVLMSPVTPLSPANLYDGKLALYFASDLRNINRNDQFNMELYSLLTNAVLSQPPASPSPSPSPSPRITGTEYVGKYRFDVLDTDL